MTQERKTEILMKLPKNSRVEYTDNLLGKGDLVVIKAGTVGFKLRNGRHSRYIHYENENSMLVSIAGSRWHLGYSRLTCDTIKAIERLENSQPTTK